ncbi:sodium/sulfate symporter [Phanerochaete sordida]|uniref:Sodium/sulfate symporter n=1 Tax=Phanerochaete sordida TaxID=48140 RepID=A0A9P3FZV0_9APHY|nr:sodium/sulfate symporter [Phanerochaete sordida]
MKFSSSLKFNAVSEWWDEYINYDALKKYVYQLEKQTATFRDAAHDLEANESTSLIQGQDDLSTDTLFIPLLDRELKKICIFYEMQETELLREVESLQNLVQQEEDKGPDVGHLYEDHDYDDEDEDEDEDDFNLQSHEPSWSRSPVNRRHRSLSDANGMGSTSRRRDRQPGNRRYSISSNEDHMDLEASIASLRSHAQQDSSETQQLMPPPAGRGNSTSRSPIRTARVMASKIFRKDSVASNVPETVWTARNNYAMDIQLLFKRRITNLYLSLTSLKSYVELNYTGFRKILKKYDKITDSNLKDRYLHDVVEQAHPFTQATKDKLNHDIDTLVQLYARCVTHGDTSAAKRQLKMNQREHIAWERDTVWRQMVGQARRGEDSSTVRALGGTLVLEPEKGLLDIETPVGRFRFRRKHIFLLLSVATLVVLLNVTVIRGSETANRCFAVLMFATLMWATEAIPLFATSMFIPLLLVCLRVVNDKDGNRLSTPQATKFIFSIMFTPTIMLLIGGFTIAAALSKTNIDKVLITRVLALAGTRPSTVLLAFMGVACFASMWISNVAAPTLCFSLIKPILRTLPAKSNFAPCLILAIALAANIGGQSSPISSPQNLIALDSMDPKVDWAKWFAVALPVSAISLVLIWLLLLVSYRPARAPDGEGELEIRPIRPTREPFTLKQYWVCAVCIVTIALWCVEHEIEAVVGDMGVIAIIPIVAFFSTGVLSKDDFDQFLWTVVFLAMGGIALGKGVTESGLLDVMDEGIRRLVDGLSEYTVVVVLSVVVLIVSTFISHTIASLLLVPIAKQVGESLPGKPTNLLIFLTALICSTGMGMPVSGFPNQTAATQEDDMGQLYLSNVDFLKNGVPASIIATMVVATVGYLLMRLVI